MKDKEQQTVLITGGGRGIGRAVALSLAQDNRFVYINYYQNEAAAQQTLEKIRAAGGQGKAVQFDVCDFTQVQEAIKAIIGERERVDILVNNAGIRDDRLMAMMKQSSWDKVIKTNLDGFYNVTKPVVKNMLKHQFGRIINIASASGQAGQAGQVNYSASKAGLIGATKALSREVAKRNITVNAVAPGYIETEMTDEMDAAAIAKQVPAGRLGKPEEVAHAVAFLCSDKAAYINGQVIGINGGLL